MNEERKPDEEKAHAAEDIEAALDIIASEQREPNRWERLHLTQAINDTVDGRYPVANVVAQKAMTARAERSDEGVAPMADLAEFSLDHLRDLLLRAKAAETLRYPRF